jgi:hypothetical protein
MGFGTLIRRLHRSCAVVNLTAATVVSGGDAVNARPRPNPLSLTFADRRPCLSVFIAEGCSGKGQAVVKKPIVVNETEARQATKEGVVRYILLVSLVLVVILFAIAYVFFH